MWSGPLRIHTCAERQASVCPARHLCTRESQTPCTTTTATGPSQTFLLEPASQSTSAKGWASLSPTTRDGWTDIFVANDDERNFLFKNRRGQGFDEVGVESFVAYTDDGVPVSSMGVDFRDWSNNGRPGLFVTALGGETFPLFRNEDRKLFTMATYEAGIGFASFKMSGWGAGIYDFDNDGFKDLFSANSHVSENADVNPQQQYRQTNGLFQNLRNATFQDVSAEAGPAVRLRAAHRGAAFGDLNNDGKVDTVVSAIGSPVELLYNTST